MTEGAMHRLVTRNDFDGLVSGVLLRHMDMIDEVAFVHPKDMQDGKIPVTSRDITTNLPYVEGVYLAIDHHASETVRIGERKDYINVPDAASASGVVFEFFGGEASFPPEIRDLLDVADKVDSGNFSWNEVLYPDGWVLLSFLLDPRTGLDRFKDFSISGEELMRQLIDHCLDLTVEEILALPDIEERSRLYFKHEDDFKEQVGRCASIHRNLVVLDLRPEDPVWPGNRFMVYALNPDQNISIYVLRGEVPGTTVFAAGRSIANLSSNTDIGSLMLEYGGGGHEAAGTCQIENERADDVLSQLIERINADG